VDLRGKRAGGGGEELQPHRPSTQRERERQRVGLAGRAMEKTTPGVC
jgi:hypothetical protein